MNPSGDRTMTSTRSLPGDHLDAAKMLGHWLLARLGKRALRPGGLHLTRRMLESLNMIPDDDVIEFGPGLGVTARLTLARTPDPYIGIERDENAARSVKRYLQAPGQKCLVASADATGLANAWASVIYGEAMLTMQGQHQKTAIVAEAARLLRPGGRYGIHELCHTELGEALRIYAEEQVVGVYPCRNEVSMAHAAAALRWIYGETAAVVTSIGPGALQALRLSELWKLLINRVTRHGK
jgi:phospholipid N-methyltransferase